MTRFASTRRVFFVEEPLYDADAPHVSVSETDGVLVVVPHLSPGTSDTAAMPILRRLLARVLDGYGIERPLLWFYTPMALDLADGIATSGVVFDCMDELSGFANAPASLRERERALLARANVVFTGGYSLYEAKRSLHPNVHACPSGVDLAHFSARDRTRPPDDQRNLARPRIGFSGVIDERMNLDLVRAIADMRPGWQFVMIGPVVKIDPATLPRGANLHYLGMKPYQDLPRYMAGWDVAMMPFAHNDATRYISPTKTPEYLAAGCPVVSTSIRDVVRPYGEQHLVEIADDPAGFVAAIERAMTHGRTMVARARPVITSMSWDRVHERMCAAIEAASPAAERPADVPVAALSMRRVRHAI